MGEYSADSNILLRPLKTSSESSVSHSLINGQIKLNQKNISQLKHSGYGTKLNYGKDVLYDFLKNEWVDWGKMLTHFSRQFLKFTKSKGDSTDISSPKCLIIDDTLLCKTGKTIEHIGKVFDHCFRTYQLGMKALVCSL